jgi:hypothetical protein
MMNSILRMMILLPWRLRLLVFKLRLHVMQLLEVVNEDVVLVEVMVLVLVTLVHLI